MSKRVIITGGSGKAGRHLITHLLAQNHRILNLDLAPLPPNVPYAFSQSTNPDPTTSVHTIRVDLTDQGQVFNALTSHFAPTEPLPSGAPPIPDALIHFAGIPHPLIVSDNETFRINTMGCYNVIEAACKLGIRKIIIASSLTVYGRTYCEGDKPYPHFPVTEDNTPVDPTDPYALSKVCCERIAESFANKYAPHIDIYALRIGRITTPEEYSSQMFKSYITTPEKWAPHGWVYTDIRDLAQMCHLAISKEPRGVDGYVVLNAVNDEITNLERGSTREFLERVQPGVVVKSGWGEGREGPVSNRKVREVLGWEERWCWRRIWDDEGISVDGN